MSETTTPAVLTCRVCGMADPPPDPTCRDVLDHHVGQTVGCPHCGRLRQACARRPCFESMHDSGAGKSRMVRLVGLAWRTVARAAAGRADR
jgi:hypothetical protein